MRKELDIDGYKCIVSDDGRVWSPESIIVFSDGRIRHYKEREKHVYCGEYMFVAFSKKCKTKSFYVHRLVAIAFIPNPNNLPCINHKDGNKHNNNVSNLEWCTYSYNNQHALHNGLRHSVYGKKILCIETGEVFVSEHEAARKLNINLGNINSVCRGKLKKTKGYHFEYV